MHFKLKEIIFLTLNIIIIIKFYVIIFFFFYDLLKFNII